MHAKTYCQLSGTIFFLMTVVHIWRVATGTPIDVAGSTVSQTVSIVAAIVTFLLGVWAFRSASSIPKNPS